jgi:lipid-binding SYLF domain-containing protein
MTHRTARLAAVCLAAAIALTAAPAAVFAQSDQQKLVDDCMTTWNNFQADPNLTWFREHDSEAVGFLIAAKVVKAGFIFGGSGGRAILVAKGDKGWAGPAFYTMGTASAGFQAGVDVSEVVTLVMNKKALESLMTGSVKAGADASVAAGPVGVGAGTKPNADFLVFTRAKGLYGGVNVNGTVIKPTEDWNKEYYGKLVSPIDIIIRADVKNKGGAAIVAAVEKAMTDPAKK